MAVIDMAALALTQCWKCAGCSRLESDNFRGDNKCQGFRKAVENVLTVKQQESSKAYEPEESGHTDNWRQSSMHRKAR